MQDHYSHKSFVQHIVDCIRNIHSEFERIWSMGVIFKKFFVVTYVLKILSERRKFSLNVDYGQTVEIFTKMVQFELEVTKYTVYYE